MKKNGKKKMNHRGFSFVELLAAIVIIGILSFFAVTAVNRYIKQSKDVKNDENIKNIKMAAQMYLQANRSSLPKNIGENVIIEAKTLRDSNYLKEDITNAKGETCMQSSVRVYHYDRDEYSYYVNMACGKEEGLKDDDTIPAPSIDIDFYNDDKATKEVKTNDVNNVYFEANICGDDACDGSSKDDEQLGIYSYSYEIYAIYDEDNKEKEEKQQLVYNSGNLKGGLQTQLKIVSKRVSEYVNFSGFTMISVKITAVNEQGISYTETVASADYKDDIAPVCKTGNQDSQEESKYYPGEAINDNDWLNKNAYYNFINGKSYESTYRTDTVNNLRTEKFKNDHTFKITAYCDDGFGSGCIRNSFVRTWPNGDNSENEQIKYQYGARWSNITIKDNANHATDCYVRANVDLKAPTVKVKVYKVNDNKGTLLKELSREFTNNNIEDNGNGDDYTISCADSKDKKNCPKDLVESSTGELWMNAANYPGGTLEIDIEMEDNLYLHDYTWELNDPYIGSGKSVGDPSLKNAKDEQGNSEIVQQVFAENNSDERVSDLKGDNVEHSRLSASVEGLKINREGKRYGKFTACDKAGNCTTVNFYFNIDITPPPTPTPSYVKDNKNHTKYSPADETNYSKEETTHWSNINVIAYIPETYANDKNTQDKNRKDSLSGFDHFNYYYAQQNGKWSWKKANPTKLSNYSSYKYGYLIKNQGTHKISFTSCDKAQNCTPKPKLDDYVRVDTYAPTCSTRKEPSDSNWHNSPDTVYGDCSESNKIGEDYSSGCVKDKDGLTYIYKRYEDDINTSYAGAAGVKDKGTVYDYAGNSATCGYKTVKIDTEAPTCSYHPEDVACQTNMYGRKVCTKIRYDFSCYDDYVNGVRSECNSVPDSVTFSSNGKFKPSRYYVSDRAGNKRNCSGDDIDVVLEDAPKGKCSISNGKINVQVTKNENSSGVQTITYSLDGTNYSSDNSIPSCESTKKTYYPKAKIISKSGLVSEEISCGNVEVPNCCSSTHPETSSCDVECGGGTATVKNISDFDNSIVCSNGQIECNTFSCTPIGDKCNFRGNTIYDFDFTWDNCSGNDGPHTTAYIHYCWDDNQQKYVSKKQNPELTTYAFICPNCGADGCSWTIIDDSNICNGYNGCS